MKKLITIITLFVISYGFCQDNKSDSLKTILRQSKDDTSKIKALNALVELVNSNEWQTYNQELGKLTESKAKSLPNDHPLKMFYLNYYASYIHKMGVAYWYQGEVAKAMEYYQKSLKIYEKTANKKAISKLFNNISVLYNNQGNILKTLEYLDKSLKVAEDIDNKEGIASTLNNIGLIYMNQGDLSRALYYSQKSLNIREELGDKKGMASCLNILGMISHNQGNIFKALEYYYKSLKLNEEIVDKKGIAMVSGNIGLIYESQSNYPKALVYCLQSLKLYKELSIKTGIANSLNTIGSIYNSQRDTAQALKYCLESLKICEEMSNNADIAQNLNTIGNIYEQKGDNRIALQYFLKSLGITEKIPDKQKMVFSLYKIGSIYTSFNDWDKAKKYLERNLILSKELGYPKAIRDAAKALKNLYQKQSKTKEALEMYELYIQMRDSINNKEIKAKSIEKEFQYAYEKKEARLKTEQEKRDLLSHTEIERKNFTIYSLVGLSIILCLVVLTSILFYRQRKLKTQQHTLQIEQKLLRLQMNPHFIFNTLTAVQGFINADKKYEAEMYLSKISRLIRAILENSREEYISLEKELQNLENYLKINQLLMDNQFEYRIETDDLIDKEQTFVPPMLAQPFVENALKHGLQDKKEKGFIIIRFKKNSQTILFEVEDNGIGLVKHEHMDSPKHQSLATTITKERLANLYGISVDRIQIHINELKNTEGLVNGTITSFEIPVKYI